MSNANGKEKKEVIISSNPMFLDEDNFLKPVDSAIALRVYSIVLALIQSTFSEELIEYVKITYKKSSSFGYEKKKNCFNVNFMFKIKLFPDDPLANWEVDWSHFGFHNKKGENTLAELKAGLSDFLLKISKDKTAEGQELQELAEKIKK